MSAIILEGVITRYSIDKFEQWIKDHPHLAGGNTFTKDENGYCSSWMQSTFEAYKKLQDADEDNLRIHMNSIGYRQLHAEKQTEILEYCRPHTDQMWAARIVSIILGCDFRDATPTLAKYFMEIEK